MQAGDSAQRLQKGRSSPLISDRKNLVRRLGAAYRRELQGFARLWLVNPKEAQAHCRPDKSESLL